MEKTIFAILTVTALLFASCERENEPPISEPQLRISASFDSGDLYTRAFFDDTSIPETWERAVKSLRIYVFDESGNWAATHEATAQQIAAGTLDLVIPSRLSGRQVTYYALANQNLLFVRPSRATMDAASDDYTSFYNSSGSGDYSQAHKYGTGYTMTARYTAVMSPYGESASVHFDLKRVVAKIAMRVKLHPRFLERFPGHTLTLTRCRIDGFALRGALMEPAVEWSGEVSGLIGYTAQTTLSLSGSADFLFYAQPSPKLPPDVVQKPTIQLHLTLTNPERSEKQFIISVPFNADNDHEVRRNGYYRLTIGVTGIGEVDFTSTLEAADWSGAETFVKDLL